MFEGVGQCFDGEKGQWDRDVARRLARGNVHLQPQVAPLGAEAFLNLMCEIVDEPLQIDRSQIFDLVQDPVNQSERIDAHLRLFECVLGSGIAQFPGL